MCTSNAGRRKQGRRCGGGLGGVLRRWDERGQGAQRLFCGSASLKENIGKVYARHENPLTPAGCWTARFLQEVPNVDIRENQAVLALLVALPVNLLLPLRSLS